MAGSYNHVVDNDESGTGTGALYDDEGINSMLECNSGDVVECVEEMYGMIWSLADRVYQGIASRTPHSTKTPEQWRKEIVEDARLSYRQGLEVSPGTGFHLEPEEEE